MTALDVYSTPEKWREIARHPCYQEAREELFRAGEAFLAGPIPALSFAAWMEYQKNGSRAGYETNYFERRGRLAAYALLARLTEERRWLAALEETIWAVCGEFSWAVPAHLAQLEDPAQMPEELDLFSTETAYALSEIHALLGGRLSPMIRGLIKTEVRRRVIGPFLTQPRRRWRWEAWENNWTAVCASGIAHALVYLGNPGELEGCMERLLGYAERFLAGIPGDGACLEGSSYWLYGFGFFAQMAETLSCYTGGALDMLSWEKAEKTAGFLCKTCLCGKWAVMISDANDMEFQHDDGLSHLLSRRFPGLPLLPARLRRRFGDDECYRFGTLLRNFLWTSPEEHGLSFSPSDTCFPEAQWYIANRESYACVVKAGCNDEPHNHNDIGHVSLVSREKGYLLCDLGAGAYTADYFRPDTRYARLNTSSRGHSVPVINGAGQLPGREYRGELTQKGADTVSVEFSRAYGQPALEKLERTLRFLSSGISLEDMFVFSAVPEQVRERFVTRFCPVETAEGLSAGGALSFAWNRAEWDAALSQESYPDHCGAAVTAYFIDFIPRRLKTSMSFQLKLEIGQTPGEGAVYVE